MKKKFSVFFMVVAITIFNFMPIMCVNAEDTDSQIIRTTTTNYHTRVIGTLNITGTDTYSKNYDSGETYIDGNYTDVNVEAIINSYKDDMSSIADSYNRATYSISGGINDYYYDAHDEITQSGTCPTDLDGALSAYPDCTITINTVLDKYQTYKLTANATTKNIKEINVNLTAPIVGEKVTLTEDTSIVCLDPNGCWTADKTPTATSSDSITIDDTAWIMGTYPEYGDGYDNYFEGTFEKDKYYYAMISISAKDGYKLSNDLTIKVNGEAPAEVFAVYNNDSTHFIAKIKAKTVQKTYTISNDLATATFTFESGHNFNLYINDLLTMTPAQIESNYGLDEDTFNSALETVKNNIKQYGTLISLYDITIDDGNLGYSDALTLKLKLTDAMKKYNTLKLIYLDENDNLTVADVKDFVINSETADVDLDHLSVYALVGSNTQTTTDTTTTTNTTSNPQTGDNINLFIVLGTLSLIGLSGSLIYLKRRKENV